jgi:ABC-2 type transport system permease protein
MSRLLRAELLKLRTTRTFAAMVGAAVALSLLIAVLSAALIDVDEPEVRETVFLSDISAVFILLLAVVGMTGEWRHRTIAGTVLAAPDRVKLVLAKITAYGAAGMVLSLAVSVAVFVVASIILSSRGIDGIGLDEMADILWRNLLVAALLGALGTGIGALIRNQAGAVVAVLVLGFVVEPTVLGLVPDVGRYLPFIGLTNGISGVDTDGDDLLAPGLAALALLAWVGATTTAAMVVLRERDLT